MYGSSELYTALNVTAVTDLLDDYLTGEALFDDNLIPQQFTGDASINFYMATPRNFGDQASIFIYTLNCREKEYALSRALAQAAINAINRVSFNSFYIVCDLLPTIPPMDETDNYNTPIEATIKIR